MSAPPILQKPPTFLVLYDGSHHAHKTIDYVKRFCLPGTKIILYGAFPTGPLSAPGVTDWASVERDTKRMDMEKLLVKAKNELLAEKDFLRADDITFVVLEADDIRDAVLDFANEHRVDTIVVAMTVVICRDAKTGE